MLNFFLKTKIGKVIIVETASTIIGNVIYKAYKEYCKACWKRFYKG